MLRKLLMLIPGFRSFFDSRRELVQSIVTLKQKVADQEYLIRLLTPLEKLPRALERWYLKRTGKCLDLQAPRRLNDKIQWLKIHDNSAIKSVLTDKYAVRAWVAKQIGERYLVSLLGVWDQFDDIDFESLPKRFVLKANHGSGWNLIVHDKSKIDFPAAKSRFDEWMRTDYSYISGFELNYTNIKPRIIAEEYLENANGDLYDYKFLCFHGKPEYVWTDTGRFTDHRRDIFDTEWQRQPFDWCYPKSQKPLARPEQLETMLELTRKLAADFLFVRVDFYLLEDESIKFGEMTFHNSSGVGAFTPDEYDFLLGEKLELPQRIENGAVFVSNA